MTDEPHSIRDSHYRGYIDSQDMQQQLYKRSLKVVVLSQIFGGAGLAAGVTVGALLAQDMLGTESFAGVPAALSTLGSAAAALFVGRLSQRYGRRLGLAAGFLAGGIGAMGVILAAVSHSIVILFASLLVYGAGSATNLQARYAGTDLMSRPTRGSRHCRAISRDHDTNVAGQNRRTYGSTAR